MTDLRPDDFEVGMVVTITRGEMMKTPYVNGFGEKGVLEQENKMYNGWLFKAKAINMPFVVFDILATVVGVGNVIVKVISLDTRLYTFRKASEDYAKALGYGVPFSDGPKILVN